MHGLIITFAAMTVGENCRRCGSPPGKGQAGRNPIWWWVGAVVSTVAGKEAVPMGSLLEELEKREAARSGPGPWWRNYPFTSSDFFPAEARVPPGGRLRGAMNACVQGEPRTEPFPVTIRYVV